MGEDPDIVTETDPSEVWVGMAPHPESGRPMICMTFAGPDGRQMSLFLETAQAEKLGRMLLMADTKGSG